MNYIFAAIGVFGVSDVLLEQSGSLQRFMR